MTAQGSDFAKVVHNPSSSDLDLIFGNHEGDNIFFGHDHAPIHAQGKARYISPGSLGCNPKAIAPYVIAISSKRQMNIQCHWIEYDDQGLLQAFEERDVPEREFIYKAFFGGRFGA